MIRITTDLKGSITNVQKKITYKKQDASKLKKEIAKNNQSSREAVKEITDLFMTPAVKRKATGS